MSEAKPRRADLKEGLSSSRKADTTHVRHSFQVYTARPCEFGCVKYERANFLRAASAEEPGSPAAVRADYNRFRAYLRAARDHIDAVLDSMERHQANDPDLVDVEGMKRAAYAVDTDAKPGCQYGPSLLPHVAPACSSLMMAIEQAVMYGLLPADPGVTWKTRAEPRWAGPFPGDPPQRPGDAIPDPIKDDPDAEWAGSVPGVRS